jgi:hypothetical protein
MDSPDLRIYITAKDIREGEPRSAIFCAVGRAVRRAIKRVMKLDIIDVTVVARHSPSRTLGVLVAEIMALVRLDNGEFDRLWWKGSKALSDWIFVYDLDTRPSKPASFVIKGRSDSSA